MADLADINVSIEVDDTSVLKGIDRVARLEKGYGKLDRAFNKGKITAQQYSQGIQQVDNALNRATASTKAFEQTQMAATKASNRMGVVTQQAGYQVSDFIVQVQSGTNVFVAFGQQASQLVGVLPLVATQLGITATAAIGLSASLGIIIPLVTAFGAYWMRSNEALDKTAKSADAAKSTIESLDKALEKFVLTQRAAAAGMTVEQLLSSESLEQAKKDLVTTKTELEELKKVLKATPEVETGDSWFNSLLNLPTIDSDVKAAEEAVKKAQERIALLQQREAIESAEASNKAVNAANQAAAQERFDEVSQMEERIKTLKIKKVKEVIAEEKKTQDAYDIRFQTLQAEIDLLTVKKNFHQDEQSLARGMNQLESMKLEEYIAQNNINVENAKILREQLTTSQQLREEADNIATAKANELSFMRAMQASMNQLGQGQSERDRIAAAAARKAEAAARQAERQRELEQREKIRAAIQKQNEETQKLEDTANKLIAPFDDFFMSIVDGTTSAKDAFRSMARDIIRELYRIMVVEKAVQSLKGVIMGGLAGPQQGPTLSGAPLGYFDGGGYTGSGPRSGGLDGKGGFMAMLHPRETVVDHTKGQGTGGDTVTINQNINVTTGVQQTVRAEVMGLMPQIAEASKAAVLDAKRRGGAFGKAFS